MVRHVAYWRQGSDEDWTVARKLLDDGRIRHGLFFAHLALEKLLKALVCQCTNDLAPRIHNLVRLAEWAGLQLDDHFTDALAVMNEFNIEGRYPDALTQPPTDMQAAEYLDRAQEIRAWLTQQF